jgi:hypothetical protein
MARADIGQLMGILVRRVWRPSRQKNIALKGNTDRWGNQGASHPPHEIAAITGHASLKDFERYTRTAERKQLAGLATENCSNRQGRVPTPAPYGHVSEQMAPPAVLSTCPTSGERE